jgi:hypothetical protein
MKGNLNDITRFILCKSALDVCKTQQDDGNKLTVCEAIPQLLEKALGCAVCSTPVHLFEGYSIAARATITKVATLGSTSSNAIRHTASSIAWLS